MRRLRRRYPPQLQFPGAGADEQVPCLSERATAGSQLARPPRPVGSMDRAPPASRSTFRQAGLLSVGEQHRQSLAAEAKV
jgi:hypothetical protein